MPAAAHLASSLTRRYGMWVNGLDVLLQPGTPGNRPGVPLETVTVTEAGPDGISAASFVIEDPTGEVALAPGWCALWDFANNECLFTGDLARYSVTAMGVGRRIEVTALGRETLLDDQLTQIAGSTDDPTSITWPSLAGYVCNTLSPARLPVVTGGTADTGSATYPVGRMEHAGLGPSSYLATGEITWAKGTSLRSALRAMDPTTYVNAAGDPDTYSAVVIVVDSYGRLRAWDTAQTTPQPSDWSTLTVSSTYGATYAPDGLTYETPADSDREVILTDPVGTTAVASDGSGLVGGTGQQATQYNDRFAGAAAWFFASRPGAGGRFRLVDMSTPPAGVHAGGLVSITDAQLGLSSAVFRIRSITKTFHGALQTWEVEYGSELASGAAQIRKVV